MKVIKFTPELTQLILAGQKTTTFRLFDDKNLEIGDQLILATREGEQVDEFAQAIITSVILRTLGTLKKADYRGHEPVSDPLHYYRQFYGDKVSLDSKVKVVRFEVTDWL